MLRFNTLPAVWLSASCFPSKPAAEIGPILLCRLVATIGRNWSNYATKTSDGMSSDDAEDDSDIGECVCGEVECLCVRGPAKLAGNPYAAYNSLPKRVSQPPKKTPGGIKQPKKKKPAAPKSRKSRQETTRVASSSPCANAKESRRMQGTSNLPSGITTQPI